jgi:hypothetical protein
MTQWRNLVAKPGDGCSLWRVIAKPTLPVDWFLFLRQEEQIFER